MDGSSEEEEFVDGGNEDEDDEDFEDEEIESKKKKKSAPSPAAGKIKLKIKINSNNKKKKDDDDDDDDKPDTIKSANNTKRKRKNIDDDDNDDNDDDIPEKVKSTTKKKAKVGKKEQYDDDDDDDDVKPKKIKSESSSGGGGGSGGAVPTAKQLKKLDKTERLQFAMQSFLWWNAKDPPEGCQWSTMEHAGVSFPEQYVPHNIKMKYDGTPVDLTPIQEEAATFFASMDPDGMHLGNPKTAPIFIKNFFDDFKFILGKKHIMKDYKKCDFGPIQQYMNEQRIIKKAITDEEKKSNKDSKSVVQFKFGYALVDGHIEKVGNYNMEPPGAFRGRGEHPKMGKLKQRVLPEQVSINVSENAPIPICPVPGHAWQDVKHDPCGMWLATWKENINNQSKYMQLAAQSSFKGKSDRSKYNKAALLCKNIVKIRQSYKKDLKSKDQLTKELATAVWVIDRLALRVGGEKDTDEEADTVGCCSLRVEHLHFDPSGENSPDCKEIELEFLGKDSMLYKQTIDFGAEMYNANNGMGSQVYDNFKSFCKRKKPNEDVFNSINPTILNNHLKQFMDGLSAKVFRTYNASKTLQDEIQKHEELVGWKNLTPSEKVTEYNSANRQVAILCNHQRSVSKAQETQLESLSDKISTLRRQKKELKNMLKKLAKGEKNTSLPTRESFDKMKQKVDDAIATSKKMKEKAITNEQKIKATEADEKAKELRRSLADAKFQKAHLWESTPNQEQIGKRIQQWTQKINKMELDLKHKDDNKEVSLGTSKINYMDPRISVAWCKRNDVPIEKIFSKTLRDKFNWAMAVSPSWEFHERIATE